MKYYLAFLLITLASCHSNEEQPNATDSAATAPKAPAYSAINEPAATAYNFLTWYKKNQDNVNAIGFIDNDEAVDSTKFYSVNLPATEEYLSALNKSGFVSKAYLDDWRKYFRQQADSLRAHPQNDGPPNGFQFDLVTRSQEPEIYLENPRKAQQHTQLLAPNRALVRLDFTTQAEYPDYRFFYLSRPNSKWLIDSINIDK